MADNAQAAQTPEGSAKKRPMITPAAFVIFGVILAVYSVVFYWVVSRAQADESATQISESDDTSAGDMAEQPPGRLHLTDRAVEGSASMTIRPDGSARLVGANKTAPVLQELEDRVFG